MRLLENIAAIMLNLLVVLFSCLYYKALLDIEKNRNKSKLVVSVVIIALFICNYLIMAIVVFCVNYIAPMDWNFALGYLLSIPLTLCMYLIVYKLIKSLAQKRALSDLNSTLKKALHDYEGIRHTDKKIFPTYIATFDKLLEQLTNGMSPSELAAFAQEHHETLSQIKKMFLSEEADSISRRQSKGKLPARTSWEPFNTLWAELNERAIAEAVELDLRYVADFSVIDGMDIQFAILGVIRDHIDNSFDALAKSKNPHGNIRLSTMMNSGVFEIRIKDSAREFPLEILASLGKRGVTTGGTGHGFANTLETLKPYGVSLIIHEYAPAEKCVYNKCIAFRFDDLGEFKILSYRAGEFKNSDAVIEQTAEKIDGTPKNQHLNKVLDLV